MSTKLRIVAGTRESREGFFEKTALGRSLKLAAPLHPYLELRLFPGGNPGLPLIYNIALKESIGNPAVLMFVHDDVYFCDFYWPQHILAGLQAFDIIGVAGNRRRVPNQSAWNTIDGNGTWDERQYLSGVIVHGPEFPPKNLWIFGPPSQEVKLLDGLLIAAQSETLLANGVGFDERFDFHFYDMDFCRQAESRQLRMGTWTLSLMHMSLGDAGSPSWRRGYSIYLDKWKC
jgi:hypothetical protein